jgi:hypothetical protein
MKAAPQLLGAIGLFLILLGASESKTASAKGLVGIGTSSTDNNPPNQLYCIQAYVLPLNPSNYPCAKKLKGTAPNFFCSATVGFGAYICSKHSVHPVKCGASNTEGTTSQDDSFVGTCAGPALPTSNCDAPRSSSLEYNKYTLLCAAPAGMPLACSGVCNKTLLMADNKPQDCNSCKTE